MTEVKVTGNTCCQQQEYREISDCSVLDREGSEIYRETPLFILLQAGLFGFRVEGERRLWRSLHPVLGLV